MTPEDQKSLDELLPLCRLQAIMWAQDDVLLHPLPWRPALHKRLLDSHLDPLVENLLAGGTPAIVVQELNREATLIFNAKIAELTAAIGKPGRA